MCCRLDVVHVGCSLHAVQFWPQSFPRQRAENGDDNRKTLGHCSIDLSASLADDVMPDRDNYPLRFQLHSFLLIIILTILQNHIQEFEPPPCPALAADPATTASRPRCSPTQTMQAFSLLSTRNSTLTR